MVIHSLGPMKVVGLPLRTTNKDNHAMEDIKKLWEVFFASSLGNKIKGKISDEIFALYYDYESDFQGAYSYLLGYLVDADAPVPEGCVVKEIPAANYSFFAARGKLPETCIQLWETIWNSPIPRAYTCDIEMYAMKSATDADLKIYIAV